MSKALENKLRRELYRKFGYTLRKSRIRIGPDNYGEYAIIDPDRNWLIAGEKFDLSLRKRSTIKKKSKPKPCRKMIPRS